jgi:hypothetical protein
VLRRFRSALRVGSEALREDEVRVDPDLGLIRLSRFVGAYDAGRIINPETARSQAVGGTIWGVGQALLEQSETDPATGRFLNRNYSGYLVPTNADIPEIDVLFVGGFDEEASPRWIRRGSESARRKGPRRADGRTGGAGDRECRLSRHRQASARPADYGGEDVVSRPRLGHGAAEEASIAHEMLGGGPHRPRQDRSAHPSLTDRQAVLPTNVGRLRVLVQL